MSGLAPRQRLSERRRLPEGSDRAQASVPVVDSVSGPDREWAASVPDWGSGWEMEDEEADTA